MNITKIQEQKRQNRANIFVDDAFFAGVCAELVIKQGIYTGKEVTNKDLGILLGEEEYQKCLAKCFDYLSRRFQSEKEMRVKLRGKFEGAIIDEAVSRLLELDYINDERFARSWFEMRSKSKGKRTIRLELIQKGIDKNVLDDLFLEENVIDELKVAKDLVQKKEWPEMSREKRYNKVGGYLARRGFDYEIIKKVLNEEED